MPRSIEYFCKLRPYNANDNISHEIENDTLYLKENGKMESYKFHRIFENVKQQILYDSLIKDILSRAKVFMLILVYGVTESGKVILFK